MDPLAGLDLSKIPSVAPPPGVVPNFIDPPSQAYISRDATYVTLPPMVVFLALRIYSRAKIAGFGVDDFLEQACGPHMWDIPLSKITASYARNSIVLSLFYYVAAMFMRASILALYIRVFTPLRRANIVLWVGIVLSTLFHIAIIAIYLGTCIPRPEEEATGGWLSPQYTDRTYHIAGYLSATSGIVGTVLDLCILFVPFIFLWTLRISSRRTMALSALFATGALACAFSTLCSVYRWGIAGGSPSEDDLTWKSPPLFAYSIGELNLGIACSCVPIIFVHFKGFASWSGAWITKIRYQTHGTKGNKQADPGDVREINIIADNNFHGQDNLPSIPDGRMKGLKSLLRNFNRTKPATTQTAMTELLTVESGGYSYHEHLRQGVNVKIIPDITVAE
ncbi:hypothetical protein GQ53DRAFT_817688 [Thozetella sp. PMI_491]|nr:hypothetical protein GQ53DRAFT_817688 [Thozetella sp. PMI_491]